MTDTLLGIGLSGLGGSAILALVAGAVHATGARPRLAHLLWLLVLVKMVVPPLVALPVGWGARTPAVAELPRHDPASFEGEAPFASPTTVDKPPTAPGSVALARLREHWKAALVGLWLVGSAVALAGSLTRIVRFERMLGVATRPGPPALQRLAVELARELGLASTPVVLVTDAALCPMVWWIGGRVRVILPASLLEPCHDVPLRWTLAHELAHVRRCDHWVRLLEWGVSVACWWNPIAWWARRPLRTAEELCCDALVVSRLGPDRKTYASSLLTAVELLATPAIRPPTVASAIDSGGSLERRLTMIMSDRLLTGARWRVAAILLGATCFLPLGVAFAQDPNYEAVGRRLIAAVEAGELSAAQAEAMMAALARTQFAERLAAARGATGEPGRLGPDERRAKLHAIEQDIWAAVKAGKLSLEQAHEKVAAVKRELLGTDGGDERLAKLRAIQQDLAAAVKAGQLTEEQAHEKLAAVKRDLLGNDGGHANDQRAAKFRAIEQEIWAAVKAGKLTEEEAHAKLAAVKRELAGKDGGDAQDERAAKLRAIEQEIWAAVKAGKLSEEQAHEKLAAIKRELAGERPADK